jgi:biopolymer transport protein ExbD
MADIAFLLLIFFLLTTTSLPDTGISVRLPPYSAGPMWGCLADRNYLDLYINADNELLLDGNPARLIDIRPRVKEFVQNPEQRWDFASSPRQALVSIRHDRSTRYATYLAVYGELRAAYREMWDELARRQFGAAAYAELPPRQQRWVRREIPMVVSEADLVDYGGGG